MASEATRTAAFLKAWRLKYPDGIAWKINDRIARSRPDVLLFRQSVTTVIECKLDGNMPTAGQEFELRKFAAAGYRVYVVFFEIDGRVSYLEYAKHDLTFSVPSVSLADFLAILA